MAELLQHEPLFPAKTELATLEMMVKTLGSPNEQIWPVRPPPRDTLLSRHCTLQRFRHTVHKYSDMLLREVDRVKRSCRVGGCLFDTVRMLLYHLAAYSFICRSSCSRI